MAEKLVKVATLPFRLIEQMGVPCGYERSVKFSSETLLANRYLLGFSPADTDLQTVVSGCMEMAMPANFLDRFPALFEAASTVFFAFEADEKGSGSYRVYLEFMDQLQSHIENQADKQCPYLLGQGFKWQHDNPENNNITLYSCFANLTREQLATRIRQKYIALANPITESVTFEVIGEALKRTSVEQLLYIEAGEPDSPRQTFDVNLYQSGLSVADILPQMRTVSAGFDIPEEQFSRLMAIIRDKQVGHISAGMNRSGEENFTLYFEN